MNDLTLGPYASLSHKDFMSQARERARVVPSWISPEDQERHAAYYVRSAYLSNAARLLLPKSTDRDRDIVRARREYGDPALLRDRVVAGVLGTDWSLVVDGADADPAAEGPSIPPAPEPLPTVDDEAAQRVLDDLHAERLAQWRASVEIAATQYLADVEATRVARAAQEAVNAWVLRSELRARIHEVETTATGLGDAVLVFWHQEGDWPRVQAFEPEAYFPVEDDDGRFPRTVHLAWEFEEAGTDGTTRRYVRRITFELAPLNDLRAGLDDLGRPAWLDEDGMPSLVPVDRPDERVDAAGNVRRRYPWIPEGTPVGEWSTEVCLYSDGVWDITDVNQDGLADLDEAKATWRPYGDGLAYRADYGTDFLPVIHVPNTPTGLEPWGQSVVDLVAQAFDDLAQTDSEIMAASRFVGSPTVATTAALEGSPVLMPGQMLSVGEGGRMDVLDLSAGLKALMDSGDRHLDRCWVNARVPAEVLGRAESGDVAGITLALRLAPFAQLIGVLRMARDPKYRLVPRFGQRMAQLQGVLEPGLTPEAHMAWGNFLPTDQTATIASVGEALRAHAISTQTAVSMLVAAGLPIDDARDEVERIRADDVEGADTMADALAGHPNLLRIVAERLGVDPPPSAPEPPTLDALDLTGDAA